MNEPPHRRIDAPRWPRARWISLSALNTYATCPRRACLQYIDLIKPPWSYQVHLSKGRVAHNILRDIAHIVRGGHPLLSDEVILQRALLRMPLDLYPSPLARDAHAHDIVRWVSTGVRYLTRIRNPTFLLIEKNLSREHAIYQGQQSYTLLARPDVILLRTDEEGAPMIEVIDYKTGSIRPEEDPPVITRFVGHNLLLQTLGDASATSVRFTYLWLDHDDMTRIDLRAEHCRDHAPTLTRHLHALVSETVWATTPSFLCNYCLYHKNICTEEVPPGACHGS